MKNLRKHWRRPYMRVRMEGVQPMSIVAFKKYPYEQKQVGDENQAYTYVSKYSCRLYVDLWVVVLQFQWITRERKDPGVAGDPGFDV